MKRVFIFSILIFLSLTALAACEKKGAITSKKEMVHGHEALHPDEEAHPTLTIYSGRKEEMMKPIFDKFKEATHIDLKVQYGGSGQLAATVVEEGKNTPADVFFSQDAGTLGWLASKGMFAKIDSSELSRVPSEFRSSNGLWVGTSGRARVLVYNTDKLKKEDLPKNIDEMLDPKWGGGRIGWAPENASFKAFVAALISERGEEGTIAWLKAMVKQEPRAFPSNTPLVTAAGKGEIEIGLTNHYYLHRLKKEYGNSFAAANYYFRDGKAESMINTAGVGIIADTKNMTAARDFVKFMLSPETQEYFANQTHEFPVIAGIKTEDQLPPISSLDAPTIPQDALDDLKEVDKVLQLAGVYK